MTIKTKIKEFFTAPFGAIKCLVFYNISLTIVCYVILPSFYWLIVTFFNPLLKNHYFFLENAYFAFCHFSIPIFLVFLFLASIYNTKYMEKSWYLGKYPVGYGKIAKLINLQLKNKIIFVMVNLILIFFVFFIVLIFLQIESTGEPIFSDKTAGLSNIKDVPKNIHKHFIIIYFYVLNNFFGLVILSQVGSGFSIHRVIIDPLQHYVWKIKILNNYNKYKWLI